MRNGRAESPVLPVQTWLPWKEVFTGRCCWAGQITKHSFVSLSNIRCWLLFCSLGCCSSSVLLCVCLNETTILHEEMKPQVNNSAVTTEVRVILLRGTKAGCILILQLHNRHFATLLPPQRICCFISCHAFCSHILDRSLLYSFPSPWEDRCLHREQDFSVESSCPQIPHPATACAVGNYMLWSHHFSCLTPFFLFFPSSLAP